MIRLAQWDVAASTLASSSAAARGNRAIGRFVRARARGLGFWLALWALVVAAEFAALVPVIWPGEEHVETVQVIYRLIGGSFAACGLIAWRRRPDSRSGLLMAARRRRLLPLGHHRPVRPRRSRRPRSILVQELWAPFFVALLLTLLTGGRLASRVDWLLVGAFVLALWVLQLVWLLFYEQDGNLLAAFPNADIADAVDKGQRSLAGLACVAVAIVVAVRWTGGVAPAPARTAAERRRQRRAAALRRAADQRPRHRLALADRPVAGDLLARQRARRLPRRPAALAPGPRRSGRPLPRPARPRAASACRRRWPRRSATRASSSPTGCPGPWATPTPTGAPVLVPPVADDRSAAMVESDGTELAALVYDASLDDDPELVEAVRAAAGMALENERLQAEAQSRLAEVQASRERIVAASDAERRRLERNLHDGAQQRLVALVAPAAPAGGPRRRRPVGAGAGLRRELGARPVARGAARAGARDPPRRAQPRPRRRARLAGRALAGARPPSPTRPTSPLPEPVELAAYFVASEALTNVAKYAQATSATRARLAARAPTRSSRSPTTASAAPTTPAGSGLRGLADRVEALDGRLTVVSPPGAGTTVIAELPCGS